MARKGELSVTQRELLAAIAQSTLPGASYWLPPQKGRQYVELLKRDVIVQGAGVASALRALDRKGLIQRPVGAPLSFEYAYKATELGRETNMEIGNGAKVRT